MARRILLGTAAFLAVYASLCSMATAENRNIKDWFWHVHNERWCMTENSATAPDCGYRTFEQCNFSRNGVGGTCSLNPRYVEQPLKRKHKQAAR